MRTVTRPVDPPVLSGLDSIGVRAMASFLVFDAAFVSVFAPDFAAGFSDSAANFDSFLAFVSAPDIFDWTALSRTAIDGAVRPASGARRPPKYHDIATAMISAAAAAGQR